MVDGLLTATAGSFHWWVSEGGREGESVCMSVIERGRGLHICTDTYTPKEDAFSHPTIWTLKYGTSPAFSCCRAP